MKNCVRCGDKMCVLTGFPGAACPDWRPRWGQRIAGIIALVIMLIMILIIVLSAIGDHVNTGRESWELRPAGIQTFRTTVLPRLAPGDPAVYLQETTAGLCEVGLQQEAVWYDQAGPHQVPTAWIRVTDGGPYDRLLIWTISRELEAGACREAVKKGKAL